MQASQQQAAGILPIRSVLYPAAVGVGLYDEERCPRLPSREAIHRHHRGRCVSKYSPLPRHLAAEAAAQVDMTFWEIDDLVGGLPASARRHRPWWSNEREGSHVQARAWLDAGWRVDSVNLTAERVRFIKG